MTVKLHPQQGGEVVICGKSAAHPQVGVLPWWQILGGGGVPWLLSPEESSLTVVLVPRCHRRDTTLSMGHKAQPPTPPLGTVGLIESR